MKKRLIISVLLLIMTLGIMSTVHAFDYTVTMNGSNKVIKNQEFTVDVNVSNIVSERGVISFGGTLEYDKDSLELVKFEGKNGWETPTEGATYGSDGTIAITRNGVTKDNGTIFTVTFKAKDVVKEKVEIKLKDVMVADGTDPVKKALVQTTVDITEAISTPTVNPTSTPTQSPEPSQIPTAKPTNAPTPTPINKLPQTGEGTFGTILIFGGAVTIAIAIFFFVEMRLIRKK